MARADQLACDLLNQNNSPERMSCLMWKNRSTKIDLFFDGYARGDLAACVSAFAVQQPMIVVGTNVDEICQNREQLESALKRDFACMSAVRWGTPRHRQVVATPAMASVFIERPLSYTADGQDQQVLFRYAFTLLAELGQWKICSAMASVPAAAGNYQFE